MSTINRSPICVAITNATPRATASTPASWCGSPWSIPRSCIACIYPTPRCWPASACKQLDCLDGQIVALKRRIEAIDRFAWPGLEQVFASPFAPAARWFRRHWYDPRVVVQTGVEAIQANWQASGLDPEDEASWATGLLQVASAGLALYGTDSPYLVFLTNACVVVDVQCGQFKWSLLSNGRSSWSQFTPERYQRRSSTPNLTLSSDTSVC